jgi:hypothetical protein
VISQIDRADGFCRLFRHRFSDRCCAAGKTLAGRFTHEK